MLEEAHCGKVASKQCNFKSNASGAFIVIENFSIAAQRNRSISRFDQPFTNCIPGQVNAVVDPQFIHDRYLWLSTIFATSASLRNSLTLEPRARVSQDFHLTRCQVRWPLFCLDDGHIPFPCHGLMRDCTGSEK